MFSVYFANRYFAPSYFPNGGASALVRPSYFTHHFFSRRYFPDRYYPGEVATSGTLTPPNYFDHGYFARTYFPDRFFPGPDGVTPPAPPALQGSASRRPSLSLDVHQRSLRLFVHPFELQLRGTATAAAIVGRRLNLGLSAFELLLLGEVTPAEMHALSLELKVPLGYVLELAGSVTTTERRQRSVTDDEDELMDWYLSTVKH